MKVFNWFIRRPEPFFLGRFLCRALLAGYNLFSLLKSPLLPISKADGLSLSELMLLIRGGIPKAGVYNISVSFSVTPYCECLLRRLVSVVFGPLGIAYVASLFF